MTEYRYSDHLADEFVALVDELDAELHRKKGAAQQSYQGFNKLEGIRDVVVAWVDGQPAACGAFKVYQDGTAEVKRVYVRPEFRGRGLAKGLMGALESHARDRGYRALVLETSKTFTEANGLYRSLGYRVTDNYPPYEGMDDSVCFRKELVP